MTRERYREFASRKELLRQNLVDRQITTEEDLANRTITTTAGWDYGRGMIVTFDTGHWCVILADDDAKIHMLEADSWMLDDLYEQLLELGLIDDQMRADYDQIRAEQAEYSRQLAEQRERQALANLLAKYGDKA